MNYLSLVITTGEQLKVVMPDFLYEWWWFFLIVFADTFSAATKFSLLGYRLRSVFE